MNKKNRNIGKKDRKYPIHVREYYKIFHVRKKRVQTIQTNFRVIQEDFIVPNIQNERGQIPGHIDYGRNTSGFFRIL